MMRCERKVMFSGRLTAKVELELADKLFKVI